jgi:hypothetical protein
MKKTISIVAGIAFTLLTTSIYAQETPAPQPQPQQSQTWEAKNNPTVAAILAQYEGKYITTTTTLTDADIFPVLGNYTSGTNEDAASITITLDETNRGLVWIEGLPQGRIKAMLRKSPATYKIPVQKTEDGKDVAEGTLIYDKETNTLSISIGKEYNSADPSLAFVPAPEETTEEVKSKKTKKATEPKAWIYTGTKVIVEKKMEKEEASPMQ